MSRMMEGGKGKTVEISPVPDRSWIMCPICSEKEGRKVLRLHRQGKCTECGNKRMMI